MSRFLLAAACGTIGSLAVLAAGLPTAPMPKPVPEEFIDKDITSDAKAWNSPKFDGPPTKFKVGHVKKRAFDAKAVQKLAGGFSVQLPSKAPIPTPTIYRDKVYVSGGFHSKEFYCFDAKTGAPVWGIDLDDDGPSAAVCADSVCVFNTESCTIFAVNADTGEHLWSHWLGDPLTSTPTIANGIVFTSYPANGGGGAGQNANPNNNVQQQKVNDAPAKAGKRPPCSHVLCALDLKTGKILWQRWIESDVMSAPVASGDELFFTSFGGVVYKLKQKDGEILSANRTRATSAPVVVGEDVFFSRRTDRGGAAVAEEGNVAWNLKTGLQGRAGATREALYLDAKVQARAGYAEQAKKLDAGNGFGGGAPQAANPQAAFLNVGQGNVCSMQAFQGSRVLHMAGKNFNCMGDSVVANDPKTGKELWSYKLEGDLKKDGGYLGAPPAAAGGSLIVTTLKGDVLRLGADGKLVKRWETKSPTRFQAAVEGGRIYVGTQDGKLICIDSGDKALTGWSCWGGNPAHTGVAAK